MIKKQIYIPEKGEQIFNPYGRQFSQSSSNGDFYYTSPVQTDITVNNKFEYDDCWSTGDFYHIKNNKVYKRKYNGELLSQITLSNPVSLSVIQSEYPMTDNQNKTDSGVWISDSNEQKLIKTDSNLNIVLELDSLSIPSYVVATVDGGCYLFDDGDKKVIKIDSDGNIEDDIDCTSMGIIDSFDVNAIDTDSENGLWILITGLVRKIKYSNGVLSIGASNSILSNLGISGSILDINVEKSDIRDYVYAVGCHTYASWIAKLDLKGEILASNINLTGSCPSLIRASQWGNSKGIYIVSEEDEALIPIECMSSSSSSSSSSSFGYSTSSFSSSSSLSSSSSFGYSTSSSSSSSEDIYSLSLLASIDDGGTAYSVCKGSTYIALANGSDGLRSYSFNGSAFSSRDHYSSYSYSKKITIDYNNNLFAYNNSVISWFGFGFGLFSVSHNYPESNSGDLWSNSSSNKNYIFGATSNNTYLTAYSLNGGSISVVDSESFSTVNGEAIWSDGTYIYYSSIYARFFAKRFDEVTETFSSGTLDAFNTDGIPTAIFGNGTYIYAATSTTLYAVEFDYGLEQFNELDSISLNIGDVYDIWANSLYICLASANGLFVYTFDGVELLFRTSRKDGTASALGVWGDDDYIYLAQGGDGLRAYELTISD